MIVVKSDRLFYSTNITLHHLKYTIVVKSDRLVKLFNTLQFYFKLYLFFPLFCIMYAYNYNGNSLLEKKKKKIYITNETVQHIIYKDVNIGQFKGKRDQHHFIMSIIIYQKSAKKIVKIHQLLHVTKYQYIKSYSIVNIVGKSQISFNKMSIIFWLFRHTLKLETLKHLSDSEPYHGCWELPVLDFSRFYFSFSSFKWQKIEIFTQMF